MKKIPVYYAHEERDREKLLGDIAAAYEHRASEAQQEEAPYEAVSSKPIADIPPATDLIGLDAGVYRQISAALRSGKQHLMLYGPPGTGKTTLAQHVAGVLHENWAIITGSADWSSQDIIGGYQPVGTGLKFVPGVLLQNFDRPLIIDELNRCDIDKVIGPLFTVLSDQPTTLPYRVEVGDSASPFYRILPRPTSSHASHEFAPKHGWRLIATINTMDKAALYQMSFALSRRFAWIYVDIPRDLHDFVAQYVKSASLVSNELEPGREIVLAKLWEMVNKVRVIGPAPVIDMARTLRAMDETLNLFAPPSLEQASLYLEVLSIYISPLLDGASRRELEEFCQAACAALHFDTTSAEAETFKTRVVSMAL
jgi:MoxR-like ATPase